jgi:hypothetical protein
VRKYIKFRKEFLNFSKSTEMNFFFIFLCILLNIMENNGKLSITECKDSELEQNGCKCAHDEGQEYIIMACQSILEPSLNRIPPITGKILRVVNSFGRWPEIPVETKNVSALILSENQIDSIGDLKNLDNLQFFNMSHNKLKKIDLSICTLTKLYLLDLSFNLFEEFHFEDLVPNSDTNTFDSRPIFSMLQYLILNGNRIKQIYNFDLVFVAMPICNIITLDTNLLTSVDVPSLSQQSQNVIEKIKQALTLNNSYLDIFTIQRQTLYYYGFNTNPITRFRITFSAILNDVFASHKDAFLVKFLSISAMYENGKIACECNTFLGINFIVDQLSEVFDNETVPDGDFKNFICFKNDSDTALNLFSLINQNSLKRTDFCDSNGKYFN